MINFRYHLVSLVAVFLALAVGIVVGSTVIDQAIVEGLRDRIDVVERRSEQRASENDRLRSEADRVEELVTSMGSFAVEHRLTGVPVGLVAARGLPESSVEATARLLVDARAPRPIVVWLEPAWALEGEDEQRRLAAVLGRAGSPAGLRRVGLAALASELGGRPADPADPEAPSILAGLVEAGFVTLDSVVGEARVPTDWPRPGSRVLVVGGPQSRDEIEEVPAALAEALAAAEVPTVLGEVWDDVEGGPERGASLAAVLDDDELLAQVATVDHLDRPEGRVVAVLTVAEVGGGVTGHYGYGRGATRSAPAWTT